MVLPTELYDVHGKTRAEAMAFARAQAEKVHEVDKMAARWRSRNKNEYIRRLKMHGVTVPQPGQPRRLKALSVDVGARAFVQKCEEDVLVLHRARRTNTAFGAAIKEQQDRKKDMKIRPKSADDTATKRPPAQQRQRGLQRSQRSQRNVHRFRNSVASKKHPSTRTLMTQQKKKKNRLRAAKPKTAEEVAADEAAKVRDKASRPLVMTRCLKAFNTHCITKPHYMTLLATIQGALDCFGGDEATEGKPDWSLDDQQHLSHFFDALGIGLNLVSHAWEAGKTVLAPFEADITATSRRLLSLPGAKASDWTTWDRVIRTGDRHDEELEKKLEAARTATTDQRLASRVAMRELQAKLDDVDARCAAREAELAAARQQATTAEAKNRKLEDLLGVAMSDYIARATFDKLETRHELLSKAHEKAVAAHCKEVLDLRTRHTAELAALTTKLQEAKAGARALDVKLRRSAEELELHKHERFVVGEDGSLRDLPQQQYITVEEAKAAMMGAAVSRRSRSSRSSSSNSDVSASSSGEDDADASRETLLFQQEGKKAVFQPAGSRRGGQL